MPIFLRAIVNDGIHYPQRQIGIGLIVTQPANVFLDNRIKPLYYQGEGFFIPIFRSLDQFPEFRFPLQCTYASFLPLPPLETRL